MAGTNLERAKKQLIPFAEMDDYDQRDIRHLKDTFAQYDSILNEHLTRLNLCELSDRLAWIPFELFQDVRQLAKGGFGTVFIAKLDYSLVYVGEDKTVALKVLDQSLLQEVVFSSQLSNIKHTVPVTTAVFGLSQNNLTKELMMVMEYGTNGNMEQMSAASSWNRITDVAIELTRRLQVMHEYGVIHQDLHPGNIVFVKEFPRFIDVGLSKAVEDWKDNDGVYGRLKYHPPEVFYRKPYTKESDIYCLATLLWQSVTGVPPRDIALVYEKRKDRLREDLIPGAPTGFNDIFTRCWDPDPVKRPNAAELNEIVRTCRGKNNLFPQSRQKKHFSPETEAFIAKCKADYQEELSDSDSFHFYSMSNSSLFASWAELEKSAEKSMLLSRRRELNKTVKMDLGQSGARDDIKSPNDAESRLSANSAVENDGEEPLPAQPL